MKPGHFLFCCLNGSTQCQSCTLRFKFCCDEVFFYFYCLSVCGLKSSWLFINYSIYYYITCTHKPKTGFQTASHFSCIPQEVTLLLVQKLWHSHLFSCLLSSVFPLSIFLWTLLAVLIKWVAKLLRYLRAIVLKLVLIRWTCSVICPYIEKSIYCLVDRCFYRNPLERCLY